MNFTKNVNNLYSKTARNKLLKYLSENPIDEIKLAAKFGITYPDLLVFKQGSDNLKNEQIAKIQQYLGKRHY